MSGENPLELSYLQHIQIAANARDRSAPFRTFFDNWFAFKNGGAFLNSNSRPHWFNNPCPNRHGEALSRAHFVSVEAARTLAGMERQRLVKDHAIPVSVLREMLIEQQPSSIDEVDRFMRRFYRFGIISQREDEQIRAKGLNSKMPGDWQADGDPFARYVAAGIVQQDINQAGWAIRTAAGKSPDGPQHLLRRFLGG